MLKKNFWEMHYAKFGEQAPSPFCIFCMDRYLNNEDVLIELGCGNGRDGIELVQVVKKYIGLDSCHQAITMFKKSVDENPGLANIPILYETDFSKFDYNSVKGDRKVIYSRFTLHSINHAAQKRVFKSLTNLKSLNWLCMVEARTIYDELYGVGKMIGMNEFETDHYRRFIDPQDFLFEILDLFQVKYFEISHGFAMYKGSDPIVMRTVFGPK